MPADPRFAPGVRAALPLAGRGVVVTREEDNGPLTRHLTALGAEVFRWPTVSVTPPDDAGPLVAALEGLDQYDWIVFSSRNAVTAVTALRPVCPAPLRVAAVGRATAEAIETTGWPVHVTSRGTGARDLVRELTHRVPFAGRRVLFPASARAGDTLSRGLRECGAQVHRVTAYTVREVPIDTGWCRELVDGGAVDALTFASPSAVSGFHRAFGSTEARRLLHRLAVAVIGPTTAAALAEFSDCAVTVAHPSTLEGLAEAVTGALRHKSEAR